MKIKYKISPVCPNFNNIVCALLVAFLLHSCNKNDYIKQECIKMQKEKVCVPVDQLKCLKSSVLGVGEERYRYILYLDSVACMPCAIRGLSAWTPIINELNGKGNLLSLKSHSLASSPSIVVFFIQSATNSGLSGWLGSLTSVN